MVPRGVQRAEIPTVVRFPFQLPFQILNGGHLRFRLLHYPLRCFGLDVGLVRSFCHEGRPGC